MKDCLIDLKNGTSFYILESVTYHNQNYALALLLNEANPNNMDVVVLEYYFENDQIMVKEIEDDSVAQKVTILLQQKLQNGNSL